LHSPCADTLCARFDAPSRLRRRERQLSELCAGVPGTRPLNGEASLLETPATTRDGAALALRVCVLRFALRFARLRWQPRAADAAAAGAARCRWASPPLRRSYRCARDVALSLRFASRTLRGHLRLRSRAPPLTRAARQVTLAVQHPWVDPATRRVAYEACVLACFALSCVRLPRN
jgi:hypothetical protein